MRRIVLCATLACWCAFQPAAANAIEVDPAAAASTVHRLLALYRSLGSGDVPQLSAEEIDELVAGAPVVRNVGPADAEGTGEVSAMGVYGWQIVDAPRLLVWLAVMGATGEQDPRLTTAILEREPLGAYLRYQHIDLPWPIADRHWVIRCEKNIATARSSDGRIWEHYWSLADDGQGELSRAFDQGRIDGLSGRKLDRSVYLPANRGFWTLIELSPERTLVVAYFDAELGGLFPGALVRSFTTRQLRAGLRSIEGLSAMAGQTYDGQPLIHDGFGQPVEPTDVRRKLTDGLQIKRPAGTDGTRRSYAAP